MRFESLKGDIETLKIKESESVSNYCQGVNNCKLI